MTVVVIMNVCYWWLKSFNCDTVFLCIIPKCCMKRFFS